MIENIKKLCFGTFATVIKICGRNLTDADIIDLLTKTIDPDSKYIESRHNEEIKHISSISRLMNCKANFPSRFIKKGRINSDDDYLNGSSLTNIVKLVATVNKGDVIQKIKNTITDKIDDDKKSQVIIVLLDIISNDPDIDVNELYFQRCFNVKKDDLLQQDEYELSDFMASILFYTANTVKVQNDYKKDSDKYVDWITHEGINIIYERYKNDFHWDPSSQILKRMSQIMSEENERKILPKNETSSSQILAIFIQAIYNCMIKSLIEAKLVDFKEKSCFNTNQVKNSYEELHDTINGILRASDLPYLIRADMPTLIDRFIKIIHSDIISLFSYCQEDAAYIKIKLFTNSLNRYNEYLKENTCSSNNYFKLLVSKYSFRNEEIRKEIIFHQQQIKFRYDEIEMMIN